MVAFAYKSISNPVAFYFFFTPLPTKILKNPNSLPSSNNKNGEEENPNQENRRQSEKIRDIFKETQRPLQEGVRALSSL